MINARRDAPAEIRGLKLLGIRIARVPAPLTNATHSQRIVLPQ